MIQKILYDSPLIYVLIFQLIFFPFVTYLAFRFGKKMTSEAADSSAMIPTTIMGLLALILGFTFSMSVERYDARKILMMTEANNIETAYLRADTVADPYRSKIKDNLKDYLETRIELYDDQTGFDHLADLNKKSTDLQQMIWKDTAEYAKNHSDQVAALFEESVNQMLDTSSERAFAFTNRVPVVVYFIIFITATIGLISLGYMFGVEKKSKASKTGLFVMAGLFAVVIGLIKDIDNPRRGLIHIGQGSLRQLKERMK